MFHGKFRKLGIEAEVETDGEAGLCPWRSDPRQGPIIYDPPFGG